MTAEIQAIPARLTEIFERARRHGLTTNAVADQMAQDRINGGARKMVA